MTSTCTPRRSPKPSRRFPDLDVADLALVCAVVLATSLVQATAGFGFALLTVPFLLIRLDLETSVIVATLIGTLANLGHSVQGRRFIHPVLARRFLVCTVLGGPVGAFVLFTVEERWLKVVLGVSILFGVAVLQRGFDARERGPWFDVIFGLVSGVLNTATSTNGPPLVFVLQARRIPPEVFRATLNTVFVFSGVYAGAIFAVQGRISMSEIGLAASSMPFLIGGSVVGVWVRARIDERRFRLAVLGLLCVSGCSTLLSAI